MNAASLGLGRINLETFSVLSPLWINLEAFLKFSFEVSEGLDDLVADHVQTSHPSRFSFTTSAPGQPKRSAKP
jgi:hypothetical protein